MGGDCNAFSYRYCNAGGMQIATGSLQDSSLAVMLRRFDEGINIQYDDNYYRHREFAFRSDISIAYLNEDIVKCCDARDENTTDLTSAEDEATKNVCLIYRIGLYIQDSMSCSCSVVQERVLPYQVAAYDQVVHQSNASVQYSEYGESILVQARHIRCKLWEATFGHIR